MLVLHKYVGKRLAEVGDHRKNPNHFMHCPLY